MARRTRILALAPVLALALAGQLPSSAQAATRTVDAADLADAVRSARPGDTVVVRGGTYTGTVGWGITPGRRDARITVKAAPGARVLIRGTLQLDDADYWTIDGIDVTTGAARTQLLVKFDGGTGWRFQNSEVWGTQGVSNVMVTGSAKNGLPRDYRISGNCIHDNRAQGDAFMNDHGIYLMPGAGSGPGLITRNLIYGIPNGAAVKAAGPNATDGAASRVTITRNTMARVAAGVILGHGTHDVTVSRNLVGSQVVAQAGARWAKNYDAAVVGNHVSGAGNAVRSNALWSFDRALHATDDSRGIARSGNVRVAPGLTGGYSCDGLRATGPTARDYGRWS